MTGLDRTFSAIASGFSYLAPPVVAFTLLAIVWELGVMVTDTPTYIIPAPSEIIARLISDLGFFAREGSITLFRALAGFSLGSAVAIMGAIGMTHSRFLEKSLFPLAVLLKVTPLVAIAPLLVIWIGFGHWPRVIIAALLAFFPVLVNALYGFRTVGPGALDFLRSINASRLEAFWLLRVPSSLPYLFASFRIAIPLSVIGAVVSEWFGGQNGLGSTIFVSHNNLDMPTLFSAIVTLAIIGIGLTLIASAVERKLLFWHESTLTQ